MIPGIVAGLMATTALPLGGALVRKNVGQTYSTTPANLSWQVDEYDIGSWHDTASNTARLTVPAGQGIEAVRVVTSVLQLNRNGPSLRHRMSASGGAEADFYGMGYNRQSPSANHSGQLIESVVSAIVEVNDGDYFTGEFSISSGTGTPNNDGRTYHAIEAIDPNLKRILLSLGSSQALAATTNVNVNFDTPVYNIGSWGVNSNGCSVPVGVSRIRVSANLAVGSVAGRLTAVVQINGAVVPGSAMRAADVSGSDRVNVVSGVIEVSPGDDVTIVARHATATTIDAAEPTWLCVEEVPADYKVCLVNRTSGTSAIGTSATEIAWQQAVIDDDNMYDVGVDANAIIMPDDGYFRVTFGLVTNSTANGMSAWATIGAAPGTAFYGTPAYANDTAGEECITAMGAWAPCSAGDRIALVGDSNTGSHTVGARNENFMCVEWRTA